MQDSKLLEFVTERMLISVLDKMSIQRKIPHQHLNILRNIESHTLMNPAKSKSIGVLLRMQKTSLIITVTEKVLMDQLMLEMSLKLKPSLVLQINSTILKKINMPHMLENH